MIKINAGISRKVGEPNYGSRGASITIELEVESAALEDPHGLQERVQGLFDMAREAVEAELAGSQGRPHPSPEPGNGHGGRSGHGNGNGRERSAGSRPAAMTPSQERAICAICRRLGIDPIAECREVFGWAFGRLTIKEASQVIDHLKQLQDAPQAGGR